MRFFFFFFFFNDTATTEIYTLSLHDALPIFLEDVERLQQELLFLLDAALQEERLLVQVAVLAHLVTTAQDRKSTRLNSSHGYISYAVFCLKKKKNHQN